jgi:hypothetical protein
MIIVENWPWGGANGTSFLTAGFLGALKSGDEYGNLRTGVEVEQSWVEMTTSNFKMIQSNLHFLSLDNVPVLKTFAPYLYRYRNNTNLPTPVGFFFPFAVCRDNEYGHIPHWKVLEYDPQFSSLFTGALSTNPDNGPNASPSTRAKSKAVSIAVGVSVGIVAIVIAAATVYFVFFRVPNAEKGIKTRS